MRSGSSKNKCQKSLIIQLVFFLVRALLSLRGLAGPTGLDPWWTAPPRPAAGRDLIRLSRGRVILHPPQSHGALVVPLWPVDSKRHFYFIFPYRKKPHTHTQTP